MAMGMANERCAKKSPISLSEPSVTVVEVLPSVLRAFREI